MKNYKNLAVVAVFAFSALATNVSVSMAQSPESVTMAREVLGVTRLTSRYDLVLPNLAERTKRLYIRANPAVEKQIAEVVDEVALTFVKRRVELENDVATVWAKNFTAEEMQVLHQFYTSSAGRKMIKLTPVLSRETLQAADIWTEALSQDLIVAVREALKARGLDF